MKTIFSKEAAKALAKIQPKLATSILDKIEAIAANPEKRHPNVEPIKGSLGTYRLRQGDWRVVFNLNEAADTLSVIRIGSRGEVYKP